jgi:hypothetical protein
MDQDEAETHRVESRHSERPSDGIVPGCQRHRTRATVATARADRHLARCQVEMEHDSGGCDLVLS